MSYVLGIDLGSSSLKGIVMNQTGKVVVEQSKSYPMLSPKTGYSEQDPASWILACEDVLLELSTTVPDFCEKLEGISFSGQMHSLVTLDVNKQILYPAILWNDVRTTKECKRISNILGESLLEITKNRVLEGFTLPKILWLQKNEPNIWEKVAHIMLPKDYLSYWLTGKLFTEYSDASGTLLLDVENKEWSDFILNKFNLSKTILPTLVESFDQIGTVRADISDKFKFEKKIKVFAGGADNACAALGAGLLSEEIALVSIGTSGVFSTFEKDITNYQGKLHFFNHVIPDAYYSMGVTLAAGNSLQWFKETFAEDKSFSELLASMDGVSKNSPELYFTPYIVGERTPHFDSQIRGSFIGIDKQHELAHFTRAVLEGITFSLKDSQTIMEQERQQKFNEIVTVGGGAKNEEWLQMQATIFNSEIKRLTVEQGPGLGACIIAAIGCKWFSSVEESIECCVSYQTANYLPEEQYIDTYQKQYKKWKKIYEQTKVFTNDIN